ncbi:hypothetical protein LQF12_02245 [Ruania suaedae]|uniref:hypothetical protein n=1 Tax=Ruania suaedae TaxID=2897774 RepID=UPI001E5109E2|nr:hypothetical protein [Ruania suaedae]UFU03453.1 hypothetical protein LQF12_02245 [Ruania suaedae]
MSELLLQIPDAWWLSSNDRRHRHDVARRTHCVRRYAAIEAANSGLTLPPQVHIGIFVGYPTRRKADPPNAWPTAKAAIDGIVDAGLLADDNSDVVYAHSFAREAQKAPKGYHTLRLVLIDQALPWMDEIGVRP